MHIINRGYETIYIDDKTYGLYISDSPIAINVSNRLQYLKDKIKEQRCLENDNGNYEEVTYYIKDLDGRIVHTQIFGEGVASTTTKPCHKNNKIIVNKVNVDGFEVICDENNIIITDINLMHFIYDYICIKRLPITNNKIVSVSLAIYKPQTKDEFLKCDGLGEKSYNKCGEKLLNLIKNYNKE